MPKRRSFLAIVKEKKHKSKENVKEKKSPINTEKKKVEESITIVKNDNN